MGIEAVIVGANGVVEGQGERIGHQRLVAAVVLDMNRVEADHIGGEGQGTLGLDGFLKLRRAQLEAEPVAFLEKIGASAAGEGVALFQHFLAGLPIDVRLIEPRVHHLKRFLELAVHVKVGGKVFHTEVFLRAEVERAFLHH